MRTINSVVTGVTTLALLGLSLGVAAPASASDVLTVTSTANVSGTVDIKYTDGRTEVSSPLWSSAIPTGVRVPVPKDTYSSPCLELTFSIQAALPVDQMADVSIDFEVWSANGTKVMSHGVSSYSGWNPGGGATQVEMLTCDPLPDGTYNLFVTTQNELSTNGLMSRYLEGKQTLPFNVANASYSKCKKGYTTKIWPAKACPKGWKKIKA